MQNLHSSARTAAKSMFKRWASLSQAKIATILMLAAGLISCSNEKHGLIVKDAKGNFYELNGKDALGNERYKLEKIDTTKYKPVGF